MVPFFANSCYVPIKLHCSFNYLPYNDYICGAERSFQKGRLYCRSKLQ